MKLQIIFSFLVALLFVQCSNKEKNSDHKHIHQKQDAKVDTISKPEVLYWCPMDTQVVSTKPGICPICDMDLEPKPISDKEAMGAEEWVYSPANEAVLSSVSTVKVIQKSIPITIRATGNITYDKRRIINVSAKVGGRIEKLYLRYLYQEVKKGDKLFDIYSHDLQTAQQEYLNLKSVEDDPEILNAARRKLLLLGMTEQQVSGLTCSGHLHNNTTVYSPSSGFVVDKQQSEESVSNDRSKMNGSSDGMGGSLSSVDNTMNQRSSERTQSRELTIREGGYVSRGETVFTIVNADVVWGVIEDFSDQLNEIALKQKVIIQAEGVDTPIKGIINYIEPKYNAASGTSKLRVYLDNKEQKLKIGSLLSAEIEAGSKTGLWVPQSAVYDLGNDKVVFVKRNGAFETRKVTTGFTSGKEIQLLSGLLKEEEIASKAQFLVDSESFVKFRKKD